MGKSLASCFFDSRCIHTSIHTAQYAEQGLCSGRVSVRTSVCLSVPSIDSSSSARLVCRHVSPTCRTDAGSGPPPLNSLTFRPVVGQPSEVVPFLMPKQRCGTTCQAMLRRPRRCRCSRTGRRHTCSAAATKLFDFELHFRFLVIISRPEQWSLQ